MDLLRYQFKMEKLEEKFYCNFEGEVPKLTKEDLILIKETVEEQKKIIEDKNRSPYRTYYFPAR